MTQPQQTDPPLRSASLTKIIYEVARAFITRAHTTGAVDPVAMTAARISSEVNAAVRELDVVHLDDGTPFIQAPIFDADRNPVPFDQRILSMFRTISESALMSNPELRAVASMFWYGADLDKSVPKKGIWLGRHKNQDIGPVEAPSDIYGCMELCIWMLDMMHQRAMNRIQLDYATSLDAAKRALADVQAQAEVQKNASTTQPPTA